MIDDKKIEDMARWLCARSGLDPDGPAFFIPADILPGIASPPWAPWRDFAKAILEKSSGLLQCKT